MTTSQITKIQSYRFELLMDAGNGAQKAGDILITSLAKTGHFVYIEPIIPAEISPPKRTPHSMSGAVIRFSGDELTNIGSYSDLMVVEHEILLERRLSDKEFTPNATVCLDMGDEKRAQDAYKAAIEKAESLGLTVHPFSINEESQAIIKSLGGNGKNMYYLGVMATILNVDPDILIENIRQIFKKLPEDILNQNIEIFNHGMKALSNQLISVPSFEGTFSSDDNILLDGNTSLSLGIVDSGIQFFSGYPITPASTIMHSLARLLPKYGGLVHQAEDEISAIGFAVGSYFAGKPSISATSGPGLSLKHEFLGLATATEIPLILVDVQRGGPSTGLPTRTEQSDLFSALFGSHGDSTKIIVSVANVEDCFYVPHIARYLTEKLRIPVIIMSDYSTSVSYKVFPKLPLAELNDINDIPQHILDRFFLNKLPDVIEMVKANQSVPGEPDKMRRVTGLNTNDEGVVVATSDSFHRAHSIRNEKVHHVRRALKEPEIFGSSSAKLCVIGWGSSRGVIKEAIEKAISEGYDVAGVHLKIVYPLPLALDKMLSKFKKIVAVETTYGDSMKLTPFTMLLRSQTLLDVQPVIANATGRPLKPDDVYTMIVNQLEEL